MRFSSTGLTAIASALLATLAPANAQTAVSDAAPESILLGSRVRQAADAIVQKGAPGITVAYGRVGGPTVRMDAGQIASDTQYPIASASKWLVAAVVMTLVDDGKLSLDKPISTWLPKIKGDGSALTLRQLLSQTSGIAGGLGELYELKQDHRLTLAESAAEVLARPLTNTPGAEFKYGAPGFQVAGAVVEAVTGQRWEEAFQQRIARPLGMNHTHWTFLALGGPPKPLAETRNPTLQGGAVSTADDYMRFLRMLAQKGSHEGRQVLSAAAVTEMLMDQTVNAKMHPTGAAMLTDAHYSLGNWCETWGPQRQCTRSSSIGAFGTYPWLDQTTGRYGIVFIYKPKDAFAVWPETMAIQSALNSEK